MPGPCLEHLQVDETRRAVTGNDFDKLKALSSHRAALRKRLEQTQELLETIDKTVLPLRGQIMIKEDEMYRGFRNWSKDKGAESYVLGVCINSNDCGDEAEKTVLKSVKKTGPQDQTFYEKLEKRYTEIYGALASCLKQKLSPDSHEVQKAVEKHFQYVELEHFHKELPEFIAAAMRVFADEKLL